MWKPRSPRRLPWRRWLYRLHRDVGYFSAGLILTYAVSGIAVNHHGDWDPNSTEHRSTQRVGAPAELLRGQLQPERGARLAQHPEDLLASELPLLVAELTERVGRPSPPGNSLWRSPTRLELYFSSGGRDTVEYDLARGTATEVRTSERPILRSANFLHLNEARSWWTIVADVVAAALAFLALSGVVVATGRHGVRGRAGALLSLGVALPLLGVWWFRYR